MTTETNNGKPERQGTLALLCAGGACGLFVFLPLPIPETVDELAGALMQFGWYLSSGSVDGIENPVYSPLCPQCSAGLTSGGAKQ